MNTGKICTRAELAADIQKFIDGSATVLDSDDIYTFSLADPDFEKVRGAVLDVLNRRLRTEKNGWCDDCGVMELKRIQAGLLK